MLQKVESLYTNKSMSTSDKSAHIHQWFCMTAAMEHKAGRAVGRLENVKYSSIPRKKALR